MQHHAYIYEGSQDLLESLIADAKKQFTFAGDNNPDLHVLQFEKFGIEDAHELTRSAQLKNISGRALFILGVASMQSQAQQALLKLFEEPQEGITFVLLVPHGILLPTLRSRLMTYPANQLPAIKKVLGSPSAQPDFFSRQATDFLKSKYKDRSAQIAALLKDEENTKERVRDFISAIEMLVYTKFESSKGSKEYREALEDLQKVRGYLSDTAPSLKMLLEHLAATVPTFS